MSFVPLPTDRTGAVQTIDWEHSRIHDGEGFLVNGKHSLAYGATDYFLLRNGADNHPHLRTIYIAAQTGPFEIFLYESPTLSADGTALTVVNYNRNSVNTAGMTAFKNPTVTGDGTELEFLYIPGTRTVGGNDETSQIEFILKPSTDYLVKVVNATPGGGTTVYSLKLFWYE